MYGIGNISATLNDVLKPFDGLGKPTIKLEFEDNAALADFLTSNKQSKQYAPYTDVTATETPTAANAKAKSKIRNGILMPADDSRTFPEPPTASALPPTKTPPPLPPAPTAKALPEYKGNWTINDIVEYSRKEIGQEYVLFEDASNLHYHWAYLWYLDLNVVSNKEICILLRYNNYKENEIKQYIDIDTNCSNAKDFWQKNSKAFDLAKQLINVSPLVWRILQIYRPWKDVTGMNYYFDYKDFQLQYWFDAGEEFYYQGFICRISIDNFVKQLEKSIVSIFREIDKVNDDDRWDMCFHIVLANDIITYVKGKVPSGLSFNNYTFDYASINGDIYKDGDFFAVKIPTATNEPPVVKFTPKKPKQKKPEIEFDNVTYITRGMPAIIMDVPQSSISSTTYLNDWWNFAERKYHYPDDIVTFVQIEDKDNGTHYSKYYQFFFKNRDKDFVLRNIRNKKNIILKDNFFIVTKLADIERIEDALLNDGNRHLVIIKPLIYDDGLGKPTIKLEFEDNADLMSLFDTDGINGLTVNDKPADIFNCPESALQTQGYKPTYRRLPDYSHLIDTADGRKTLKGYGFDRATLDELINACTHYPQVARLADHLKDPAGDPLQSAFNVWHWLHTNIRYAYDTPGEEEIRTPARVWADRESGVDCDCLAVMTACLLINMGLNPKFEIVAFNDEPTFSHIYVNLDGAAIDRVLPVFLARPDHITKTQIMDIPVYQLSGIGGCDALSGVYSSTLAKLQQGTATGEDINDFRKTQVLVTLRGIDDAAYSLAALLMPHVVTIADDGTYYFDSTAMAQLATKLDHDLADLISSNADADTISQWIAAAAKQIDGAASVTSNGGDDTIVVIINPQGATTRVIGQMVKSQTDTLTPLTQTATATDTAAQTYAQSATPAIMQTSAMPGVSPDGDTANEESDSNNWLWIAGIAAAFGIGAAVASNKKKRR